ncbi:VanW family protein [Bacillus sp. 1NLA3E]|uniref:VanW family protein n=1 Tax=Bacillus sp. 1NLA3E TaxID=666686 RepID=UPI000247EB0D|nr:VanW family protein [Bacillus sp. 1NLA3E]
MRNGKSIKLFIVLFLCTAFIYSFSHFGALAYESMTSTSDEFATGTKIGPIDVSGKTKSDALKLLSAPLQKWRSETKISLQYKEKTIPVDVGKFQIDLENSVATAKDGQQNEVIVTFKSSDLRELLKNASKELEDPKLIIDPILTELISYSTNLSAREYQLSVEKFLPKDFNKNEVLSEATITCDYTPLELGILVERLSPIKIEGYSQVSLLKLIEAQKLATFSPEAASMLATTIYEAILSSNFTIVERQTGVVLPEYASLGMEAKVDLDTHLDLVFVNPNDASYEIQLQRQDNTLTATLNGSKFLFDYKINIAEKQEFKPKTIIQYSPLLPANGTKVQQEGANGFLIKVYREIYDENGAWIRKEAISEDFYPPVPRIELHALTSSKTSESSDGQTDTSQATVDSGQNTTQYTNNKDGTASTQQSTLESDLYGKENETMK